jgi:hypothetical protein
MDRGEIFFFTGKPIIKGCEEWMYFRFFDFVKDDKQTIEIKKDEKGNPVVETIQHAEVTKYVLLGNAVTREGRVLKNQRFDPLKLMNKGIRSTDDAEKALCYIQYNGL